MRYKVTAPDGNSYFVNAPEGASLEDVKSYAKAHYQTTQTPMKPTVGQRLKGAAGKIASKAGQEMGKVVPPFMKQEMTWPEIAGQVAGESAGVPIEAAFPGAGVAPSVILGGLGGAGGRTLGNAPRALGEMLATRSIHTPMTHQIKEDLGPAFERGATFSALGKALPMAWRGAKFLGREAREGMGAMSGVTERMNQLRKLPIWEQFKVLNPLGRSIPETKVAGAAQEATEKRLGVPTMGEVTKARIYSEPKAKLPKSSIPPSFIRNPEQRAVIEKAMGKPEVPISPKAGESTPVMRSVAKSFEQKVKPVLNDAVQALRDTLFRVGKLMPDDPAQAVYAKEIAKLNHFLESEMTELMKARKLTHLSHMREAFMHLLPLAPKGTPYRFGIMRLLWHVGSLLATGGLMSPIGSGMAQFGTDLLAHPIDQLLSHQFAAPAISGALATRQKMKQKQSVR